MSREATINAAQAINEALHLAMAQDEHVLKFGLGVDDPKAIFNTTAGLQERFGAARVFDTPTSENGMTGIAIGAALAGMRPVMCHQRLDFFLLALDQLVNNAAKWHYTFGRPVPLTIRLIMGRGWGQGPTHSQNLQAWFAHVPGLKVVMPANAADAKGLLLSSIFDDDPVVFLEHRWLHFAQGEVPEGDVRVPLGKAAIRQAGDAVTIVAASYMVVEALHACRALEAAGVHCELIDLRTVKPLDWDTVYASVRRTGRLLALDTGAATGSIAGEIVARASMDCWSALKAPPLRLALPDCPEPTSYGLTRQFYPGAEEIVRCIGKMLGLPSLPLEFLPQRHTHHDVPGVWFSGPF
ncbi:MAG: alpha-ketoacid dehydrogenase subunit beta [Paludibacterium sp.]|uniref:alpha-ketoacid dehydrogenase subunit beta n=1 Tax=Paludibacterium sp. TaxID=1917523 RepID=UPI0025FE6AF8|nr:transketolase C-terminal domain-containing protein [Paludibacterium sp.]MBV8048668.1 alpha-ketoacid dehydrogenase subunit beta [Paludibacterium sp.]MBV8645973.1 alpha-ketoacid dehydrogenase subunit beta [Paludibacterium sp.]